MANADDNTARLQRLKQIIGQLQAAPTEQWNMELVNSAIGGDKVSVKSNAEAANTIMGTAGDFSDELISFARTKSSPMGGQIYLQINKNVNIPLAEFKKIFPGGKETSGPYGRNGTLTSIIVGEKSDRVEYYFYGGDYKGAPANYKGDRLKEFSLIRISGNRKGNHGGR